MTAAGDILGGKYRLGRLLGEGGMGQVFEAVNQNTDRRVAIKTLHAQWTREPSVVQRFLREARAATKIHHPNVVDVLDLDTDPATQTPYIVQEFLSGESLEDLLDARPGKHLPVDEALRFLVPVMGALVAAHELGIVHRDLKPANLFASRDRSGAVTPKVIDFGIAKLMESHNDSLKQTQTGSLIGTPRYMSPEQAAGASDIDARTDVWSLGVVFYEMLTGALPYDAPNHNVLVAKLQYEPPVPIVTHDSGLPPDVVAIIDRALQKKPADRFPTMQAMLDAAVACDAWAGSAVPGSQPRVSSLPSPPPPPAPSSATPAPVDAAAPLVTDAPLGAAAPTLVSWSGRAPAAPRRRGAMVVVAAVVALAVAASLAFFHTPRSARPVAAALTLRSPSPPSPEPPATVITVPSPPSESVTPAPTPAMPPPSVPGTTPPMVASARERATRGETRQHALVRPPAAARRPVPRTSPSSRSAPANDFDPGYPQ
ncbi:MAG: putative serine/threonine-protein kinase pknB [Myxococcaceae bacterium]|nr:putative serine/threonine-protein kinase pknB [Myxococcaceae bacterium]